MAPAADPVLIPPGTTLAPELQAALADLAHLSRLPAALPQGAAACERALRLVDRRALPNLWAALQAQSAQALAQDRSGDRAANLERSIAAFEQALTVFSREAAPRLWAGLQNDLGLALVYRIRGDRAQNLAGAIQHLEQALRVHTRAEFPLEWSDTQDNLGIAHWHAAMSGCADQLEQAIEHFRLALEVRTRQQHPDKWADTHHNLAGAYLRRIRGDRAENLERAIDHCRQALQVRSRGAAPDKWAITHNTLANAYERRLRGDRADNLEQAIASAEGALAAAPLAAWPEQWAMIQHTLAACYAGRVAGDRADNLEQAIAHAEQALQVYTQPAYPELWATVHNSLGDLYRRRLRGDRGENLERSIGHLNQALEVRTRRTLPQQWAETVHDLANSYLFRLQGERAENLERAIALYLQALERIPPAELPEPWALLQANLGVAYQERIRGDFQQNIARAVGHTQQALQVATRTADPRRWAALQNNLGNMLSLLPGPETGGPREEAIEAYRQALEVRTREALPEEWAETQNNLGRAYLAAGGRPGDAERAIEALERAREVWTRETYPEAWAGATLNLAVAWQERPGADPVAGWDEALRLYEQAAGVFTRERYPLRWAGIRRRLASLYAGRARGEAGGGALPLALALYGEALEVYTPEALPAHCRDTAYDLGCLLYDHGDRDRARAALETAHRAVEALRGEVSREAARRALAAAHSDLYARLVACCLWQGDALAAFEYATAAKGRAFVDALAGIRLDLERAGAGDPELRAGLDRARALRDQVDALLALLTGEGPQARLLSPTAESLGRESPPAELYPRLLAAQRQHRAQWDLLALRYPALTATQQSRSITAPEARQLAADLAVTLVEYYRHAAGWCAFVVTAGDVRQVPLPELGAEFLARMRRWVRAVEQPAGRGRLSYKPLDELYQAALTPLGLDGPPAGPLVLAPFGSLHLLPLAAARDPGSGRYAAEQRTLAFAPSLSALHVALQQLKSADAMGRERARAAAGRPLRLLTVAYPGSPGSPYHLGHVLAEAEAVARCFVRVERLAGSEATVGALLALAARQEVIHLGCHGWFDEQLPDLSGLMLADGWLTVQRIIAELRLHHARLVTLGACLTGQAEIREGEEYVGLTQAILTAGAQAVVSSLWSVDDAATRALFQAFYPAVAAGKAPAGALREAAAAVRRRPGWQHPYYWAAFAASGLAVAAVQRGAGDATGAAAPPVWELRALLEHSRPEGDRPAAGTAPAWDMRALYQKSQEIGSWPTGPDGPMTRGGKSTMDHEQLFANLMEMLEELRESSAEVAAALPGGERAQLVAGLQGLRVGAEGVQDEQGLLDWMAGLYALLEGTPGLQGLLFEPGAEPAAAHLQRKITQADLSASAERSLYAQQRAAQMRNAVLECCRQLQQGLEAGAAAHAGEPPRAGA